MADLEKLTVDVLKCPRITLDELRSYAGKANHVATLVYYWRPFLDQVWAAPLRVKAIERASRIRMGKASEIVTELDPCFLE